MTTRSLLSINRILAQDSKTRDHPRPLVIDGRAYRARTRRRKP